MVTLLMMISLFGPGNVALGLLASQCHVGVIGVIW